MADQLDFQGKIEELPKEFFSTPGIKWKTFKVLTAVLELIIRQVKYFENPLSKPGQSSVVYFSKLEGRVFMSLVSNKQKKYDAARETLRNSVDEFMKAVNQGDRLMSSKVFTTVQEHSKTGKGEKIPRSWLTR
jgi:hypothetical protein